LNCKEKQLVKNFWLFVLRFLCFGKGTYVGM